jgi:hypothetical protein
MQIIKSLAPSITLYLEIIGDASSLFRKPNSLSKIKGSPAFKDPVKDVKTIMPQLRNGPYLLPV